MEDRMDVVDPSLLIHNVANTLRQGGRVLLYDNQTGERAFILAAQFAHAKALASLVSTTLSSLYVVLSGARLEMLGVPYQQETAFSGTDTLPSCNGKQHGMVYEPPFTELACAIQSLVDPGTPPGDLSLPDSLSLVRGLPGGVLKRHAVPEAALELMHISGLEPVAVVYQLVTAEGRLADDVALTRHLANQEVQVVSLDEIVQYRQEHRMSLTVEAQLPTAEATFRLRHYQDLATGESYLALILGDLNDPQLPPPLLRLHSSCTTGDIFGSLRCDCQAQMHVALHEIAQEKRGVFIYLPQEGRGIGLVGKLHAYVLQEQGYDTIEANTHMGYPVDARSYAAALEILRDLHITHVQLLTNNPEKVRALRDAGIDVKRVSLEIPPSSYNQHYLQTKQQRMGHLLAAFSESDIL